MSRLTRSAARCGTCLLVTAWRPVRMVKPESHDSAAQAEQVAQATDAELSSRDAIMSTTPAGIVSSWNPPAVLLYGYLAEDIVGRAADVLCAPEERAHEARSEEHTS